MVNLSLTVIIQTLTGFTASISPVKEEPSQYLILILFQLKKSAEFKSSSLIHLHLKENLTKGVG